MAGRTRLSTSDHDGLTDRLRQWMKDHLLESREEFADKVGIPRSTASSWFSKKQTSPELAHVLKIARSEHVSLNWLLLGQGPQLIGATTPYEKVGADLRATIAAELERRGTWEPEEVEEFLPTGQKLMRQTVRMWRRHLVRGRKEAYLGRVLAVRRAALQAKIELPQRLRDMGLNAAEVFTALLTPDDKLPGKYKQYELASAEKQVLRRARAMIPRRAR